VPNASVSLQHRDGGTALTTVSDSDGKFRFSGVEGGAYTLLVEARGYFKATYEFVLRPRQPISLNVELQEKQKILRKPGVPTPSRDRTSSGCLSRCWRARTIWSTI
jgi:hypothetical protein